MRPLDIELNKIIKLLLKLSELLEENCLLDEIGHVLFRVLLLCALLSTVFSL